MESRYSVGTYPGNELIRNSSGNTRPQSSQLADPLWTNSGLNSVTGVHWLNSTLKKKIIIKAQAGTDLSKNSTKILMCKDKSIM